MTLINFCIALVGAITGISGLVLSIVNFLRDNPSVQVQLDWDMSYFGPPNELFNDKFWGHVTVVNIGRRPIFISHAHLEIPGRDKIILIEGIRGQKLSEGDPPKVYLVDQEGLNEYRDVWRKMRAVVIDSSGKKYRSQHTTEPPSWSKICSFPKA